MQGIYCITNTVNNKKYVGLSTNIPRRISEHKTPKSINIPTKVLSKAMRKYGISCFDFSVLEVVDDISKLPEREIYWIKKLKPNYNMNSGGIGNRNLIVTDEVKDKLREIGKAQWGCKTQEDKDRQIKNNLRGRGGFVMSEKQKELLRIANLGKKASNETKKKISNRLKIASIGNKNGNKKILCTSTGRIYESAIVAAKDYKIHPSCITKMLKGIQKNAGGVKWEYYK